MDHISRLFLWRNFILRHFSGMCEMEDSFLASMGNAIKFIFIPLGFALPVLFERIKSFLQVLILSFSISLLAETLQLVLRVGCFDVDDLLLNTIGGCVGYLVYRILRRYIWKRGTNGQEKL